MPPPLKRTIEALKDEFLYVRIFAAGALGSIGLKARSALEALRAAADDPALRDEAAWALGRIAGGKSGEPVGSHPVPAPFVARLKKADEMHQKNALEREKEMAR